MTYLNKLPDFIVNSSTNDFQVDPVSMRLNDGRVFTAWRSFDRGDGLSSIIRARFLSSDGTALGSDFIVNTSTDFSAAKPSIAVLANGTIAVSWQSDDTQDGSLGCIKTRLLSADGTPLADEFITNSTVLGAQYAPNITALTDGRFVVTWDHYGDGSALGDNIYARIFAADGTPSGADFIVNAGQTGIQSAPKVTAVSNGGFIATWVSETGDGSGSSIVARMFNAQGVATTADFTVNSTVSDNQTQPVSTALLDDRLVFAWASEDAGDGSQSTIRARLYSANGTPVGADFIVNTTSQSAQLYPTITTLIDGRFVVAWVSEDEGDGSESCIRARVFDADGNSSGNDFIVNTTTQSAQVTPTLTALNNGHFQVSWTSFDEGDGSLTTIRSTIIDPLVFNGTAGDDLWRGGNLSDTFYGNEGSDTFYGNEGADILDGGFGSDIMEGGNGNDVYYVDEITDTVRETNADWSIGGDDLIYCSILSGTYILGDNIEKLTLLGTTAVNGTGNILNNTITGNSAANVLNGKEGDDTLIGGNGNDTYFVDSVNDVVVETNTNRTIGGDDLIRFSGTSGTYVLPNNVERLDLAGSSAINGTGNTLNNTILANNADNVINGYAGNDTLNGRGGNDTLIGSFGNDTLTGGAGADKFVIWNPIILGDNVDKITDFTHAIDDIGLGKNIFAVIGTTLDASEIAYGAQAKDANDYIVYDSVTGNIFYDADGTGSAAQILFANVTAGTILDENDFYMI